MQAVDPAGPPEDEVSFAAADPPEDEVSDPSKKIAAHLISKHVAQPKFLLQALGIDGNLQVVKDLLVAKDLIDMSSSIGYFSGSSSGSSSPRPPSSSSGLSSSRPSTSSSSSTYDARWNVVISKRKLAMLESVSNNMKGLKNILGRKIYQSSPFTRALFATALARCPAMSLHSAEIMIAASHRALLHDAGIDINDLEEKITCGTVPSKTSLTAFIDEIAEEKLAFLRIDIADKIVYLACDKGNKKGIGHFVKHLSFYDDVKDKVQNYLLDINASGGTSKDCAEAINYSLRKVDGPSLLQLYGQMTDAGEGGRWGKFET